MTEEFKDVAAAYGDSAQAVTKGPAWLIGAIVTPDGTNKTYIDIYDGESAADDKIARIRANTPFSNIALFPHPIKMVKGIYIAVESNLESFTILWSHI